MTALRNLSGTVGNLGMVMNRLSTGLRINDASDDPAGLIISEDMRSQLKGLDQAIRNAQDAVNMSKTAESALDEVQRLLRNIRGLAVHSANTAVVDSAQLQANQSQIRSTLQSIDRIAQQTQWGSKRLLDGSAGFQATVTNNVHVANMYIGSVFNGQNVAPGAVIVDKVTAATRASVTLGNTFANANTVVATQGTFVINGYSFSSDGTETVQTLVNRINQSSDLTGVTASVTGAGPVSITLTANEFGANYSFTTFDPSNVLHNAASATATGVNGLYNVTVTTTAGPQTVGFTGGQGPKDSGLRLTDGDGNVLTMTAAGNQALVAGTPVTIGQITGSGVRFQIGANENQAVQYSMPTVLAKNLGIGAITGETLATIDVTTQTGAQNAMKIIDAAITQLSAIRGELGSFQTNFLDSTVRSLGIAKENLTSSESQIRDADIAEEMTSFTKLQILQQSGMAILAQANSQSSSVLSLLRGQ